MSPVASRLVGRAAAARMLREGLARARRAVRSARSRLRKAPLTLVFHSAYRAVDGGPVDPDRGRKILHYLFDRGCIHDGLVLTTKRADIRDLSAVHSHEYLESLDRPDGVERALGVEGMEHVASRVIEQQRMMVGGTLLATRTALSGGRQGAPVINLGGGLHHAHSDHGEGFCLFNDVAIAIRSARSRGFSGSILVVDLDLHHGNGTRKIFAEDETVFTFSVHATSWDDSPAVADLSMALGPSIGDSAYLRAVREGLSEAFERARPDLVYYVAGVDVAAEDGLGSWQVTHDGIFERDRLVRRNIGSTPSVWVLAGGYGVDAWRHTARTLAWLAADYDRAIESHLELDMRRFRSIARGLPEEVLTADPDGDRELTLEDLVADFGRRPKPTRFLGYYSKYGLEIAAQRYGVRDVLRQAGYPSVRVELELDNPRGQVLRILSDDVHEDLLMELNVRESKEHARWRLLSIEWLLLQNPRARPTADRPLLPEQQHPGLGLLSVTVGMLLMACDRLGYDGLLYNPAHYHMAFVARTSGRFLDPVVEGRFRSAVSALSGVPLPMATRAVDEGRVVDAETNTPYRWQAMPMVFPASDELKQWIGSPEYQERARQASNESRLELES